MKYIVALSAFILPLSVAAQNTTSTTTEPPIGATTVLIQTPDSAKTALKSFARTLVAQGYTIEKQDYELGYFTTGLAKAGTGSAAWRFKVVADTNTPSTLSMTGTYLFGSRYGIKNESMRYEKTVNYRRMTFIIADELAKKYPQIRGISYSGITDGK